MRRTRGRPTSSNGASSLHLRWVWDGPEPDLVAVHATLTVLGPTPSDHLRFWAIQASFVDRGRHHGAAHLGLQRHAGFPGGTAANWGGYAPEGGELAGEGPNTQAFAWEVGRPHRLSITPGWTGRVDGEPLRTLPAGGTRLAHVIVWSEVFAPCGEPHAVRWSDLSGETAAGDVVRPSGLAVNYQRWSDGGCTNTDSSPDEVGVVQRTGTRRRTPQGALLSPTPAP